MEHAVAEFALAQLLALIRNLPAHNEAAHHGRWSAPAAPLMHPDGIPVVTV